MIKLAFMFVLMPVVGRMPRTFYRVADFVGRVTWVFAPGMRRKVARNVAPFCAPGVPPEKYTLDVFRNAARYYVDLAAMPYRDVERYYQRQVRIENPEQLALMLSPTSSTIVVSAHTGNPEPVIAALAGRGREVVALVEPLEPEAVNRFVQRRRNSSGGRFMEADFSGLRAAVEALHRNEVLAVVADRDINGTGVCVDFAGRRVKLPSGPWELARRTGATIVPAFARRLGFDVQSVWFDEPFCVAKTDDAEADVAEAATRWAALLEAHIRRDPGQWTVLEDFWEVHGCG